MGKDWIELARLQDHHHRVFAFLRGLKPLIEGANFILNISLLISLFVGGFWSTVLCAFANFVVVVGGMLYERIPTMKPADKATEYAHQLREHAK